ncbi:MAG: PIN domain-containing protein [Armatimonadota bacterium]|nr:PIN domain-containing protein [Armatimonadota bacterium]MDR7447650.1 PIN domain-containing protein [Armatimonadota bacterium]MDR7458985.1 PIN domain-containing protein [Armatimonadota bacterium]MDR7480087.1 PIN domain-containing protein [Armatimonadota bacterium]MDR7488782.1 PIN domain-containing protein [Armatimonadota bacterium]
MLTVDASVWVASFDPGDRFHQESRRFLHIVGERQLALHAPALLLLEVACALARRAQNGAVGRAAARRLRTHPTLQVHPVDSSLLSRARDVGTERLLRAADALYVATAEVLAAPLVSWDKELVQRAGARTPPDWLGV